jgi:hypothetical protein
MPGGRFVPAPETLWIDLYYTDSDGEGGWRAPKHYGTPITYPTTNRERNVVKKELERLFNGSPNVSPTGLIPAYRTEEDIRMRAMEVGRNQVWPVCIRPHGLTYRDLGSLGPAVDYEEAPGLLGVKYVIWNGVPRENLLG